MAFYAIPVTASKVSGSHSNFPALVEPSSITGLGSLTLAEAQSARFYSDVAKTTELAREVVAADEIWVKVTSMTTTTTIYVDIDGVSSDYAVTDTYGRNAVWSDYLAVWHMDSSTDATGNGRTLTANGGVTIGGGTGQAGGATDFDATNDYLTFTAINFPTNDTWSITYWANQDTDDKMAWGDDGNNNSFIWHRNSNTEYHFKDANNQVSKWLSVTYPSGWGQFCIKFNGDNQIVGNIDGVDLGAPDSDVSTSDFDLDAIGIGHTGTYYWGGLLDEIRVRESYLSDDWNLTEYNCIIDNGAFWGTAYDAGANYVPKITTAY